MNVSAEISLTVARITRPTTSSVAGRCMGGSWEAVPPPPQSVSYFMFKEFLMYKLYYFYVWCPPIKISDNVTCYFIGIVVIGCGGRFTVICLRDSPVMGAKRAPPVERQWRVCNYKNRLETVGIHYIDFALASCAHVLSLSRARTHTHTHGREDPYNVQIIYRPKMKVELYLTC